MKPLLIATLSTVLVLSGCGRSGNTSSYDAELQKRTEAQWHDYDRQSKRADEYQAKVEQQNARFDRIMDKWEEQARRQDAILEAMEKQHGIAR